jgi:uncharacterized protein (DUF1800 family)
MLTRRMFLTRLLASVAAALGPLPRPALATTATPERAWLNRLTFGATPEAEARLAEMGREAWLDWQLSHPVTDPGLEARLAEARLRIAYDAGEDEDGNRWPATDELRPLAWLAADPADRLPLQDWGPGKGMNYAERTRPAQEVIAASLIRAVHAEGQLREVMTQFWHDHFNVDAMKDETTASTFPAHDATLRAHALGNFRVLLGEVARSPAMLYYLNNADSIASPANENYARELLELHTLGAGNYLNDRTSDWRAVPGATEGLAEGYLDLDVYEVARAFTGWSVGDGRWITDGEQAPRTGVFHYVARWHDPYQKRVLGREFPPNRGPMADGDEVLDILAGHPGTARFICEKIARRLLADDPDPALVERLAQVFLGAAEAPDQIAQVLRALVLSPDFDAPPTKLRRPFEMLAALLRATGAAVDSPETAWHWELSRAGWRQHEYGPPTGHPDRLAAWTGASSLNRLVDIALYALEDWWGTARADFSAPAGPDETLRAFLFRHAHSLAPSAAAGIAAELAEAYAGSEGMDGPVRDLPAEKRHNAARNAAAFAALTPEFLFR